MGTRPENNKMCLRISSQKQLGARAFMEFLSLIAKLPTVTIGYAAAICVILTFCASNMLLLRGLAICSNLLFMWYGRRAGLDPILLLHAILLPINIAHTVRIVAYLRRETGRT
jgi:hypothetical protein